MSENLLQIDATNFKYEPEEGDEEDFIKLQFRNEDHIEVRYSKLVRESKYVRDKYKYSEAKQYIQQEINDLKEKYQISDESVKSFIQLIETEKVSIRHEIYRDFYTLCKYFKTLKYKKLLDNIFEEELFSNLDFSLEILLSTTRAKSDDETEIASKIEKYLSLHVNECIKKEQFGKIPISTIFRIIEKSTIEKVDMTSLVDFIIESAPTRFTLFKFVLLHKVESAKLDELIDFISEQNEETREVYTGFIGPSLSFIKEMKRKNDELSNSLKSISEELNHSKEEKDEMRAKLDEKEKTIEKLNQVKNKFEEAKSEIEQIKQELKKANEKLNEKGKEEKQQERTIIVGGYDRYNLLGEKPNNKNVEDIPAIFPPLNSLINSSSLLSYSVYCRHSVLVTRSLSLLGIGYNRDGQISSSLTKTEISQFTEFSIKGDSGCQLSPISAVCSAYGTLYMFSKSSGCGRQLVYCDEEVNGGDPVFLDIGDVEPVSLFGGRDHAAAISDKGEVIFINRDEVQNSPNSRIATVSLPDGEKASSVACLKESVVVLISNGRVFSSSIESDSSVLRFSPVSELGGYEIVWVSGTDEHCLAVSKEGRVFGLGSNEDGKLGLSEKTKSVSSFTEISSLLGYKIRAAYAGCSHSLFETREGKILSCGYNGFGELLLSSGPSEENVYSPRETMITGGATFCIAGNCFNLIFIGGYPPPNTPNMPIQNHQ